MRVLDDSIQVRTFDDADALKAHYRAVRARRERANLRVVPEQPAPVVRTIDVAQAKAARDAKPIILPVARPRPDYVPERDWLKVATCDQVRSDYSIRYLTCLVGKQFNELVVDILSERRKVSVTYARHVTCWLAKRFTSLSLPQIGDKLGGRDHTTIMHGANRIKRLVERLNITPSEETPQAWVEALQAAHPKWGEG